MTFLLEECCDLKNITLAIDEKVLKQARAYAASHGTTLNALVREHLVHLLDEEQRIEKARQGLLDLIDKSTGRLGPGWKWNREDAYEGRLLPGHQRPGIRRGRKAG
jgi:hypothetical protein